MREWQVNGDRYTKEMPSEQLEQSALKLLSLIEADPTDPSLSAPFVLTLASLLEATLNDAIILHFVDERHPDRASAVRHALLRAPVRRKLRALPELISGGEASLRHSVELMRLNRLLDLRNSVAHATEGVTQASRLKRNKKKRVNRDLDAALYGMDREQCRAYLDSVQDYRRAVASRADLFSSTLISGSGEGTEEARPPAVVEYEAEVYPKVHEWYYSTGVRVVWRVERDWDFALMNALGEVFVAEPREDDADMDSESERLVGTATIVKPMLGRGTPVFHELDGFSADSCALGEHLFDGEYYREGFTDWAVAEFGADLSSDPVLLTDLSLDVGARAAEPLLAAYVVAEAMAAFGSWDSPVIGFGPDLVQPEENRLKFAARGLFDWAAPMNARLWHGKYVAAYPFTSATNLESEE